MINSQLERESLSLVYRKPLVLNVLVLLFRSFSIKPVPTEEFARTVTTSVTDNDYPAPLEEDEPVAFESNSRPMGYDDDIARLAGTKFGTTGEVIGEEPTFTVRFEDTRGQPGDSIGNDSNRCGRRMIKCDS